ncbi:protein of unknown function [Streptantibioticus cattleyicolor NRRL 8057 = DSM 46488]|nr:protein of unknown function [Streptantibioticus cattleyicolor NRRL 8057 = DSM 46488]
MSSIETSSGRRWLKSSSAAWSSCRRRSATGSLRYAPGPPVSAPPPLIMAGRLGPVVNISPPPRRLARALAALSVVGAARCALLPPPCDHPLPQSFAWGYPRRRGAPPSGRPAIF